MFHKILAAVDSSERAAGVLEIAVGLARASSARLYVLRVVTIPPEFPPCGGYFVRRSRGDLWHNGHAALR